MDDSSGNTPFNDSIADSAVGAPRIASTPSSLSGRWLILIAAILWGTTGTAQAFAPVGATPGSIGAIRLIIGGLALLGLALGRKQFHDQLPWPRLIVLLGAGAIAAYQLCFFAGVARTGVATGALVAIGSAPILAGLLGIVVLRERPSRTWFVATALAIGGCTLLITAGGELQIDTLGILLALGAGASYAGYTAVNHLICP